MNKDTKEDFLIEEKKAKKSKHLTTEEQLRKEKTLRNKRCFISFTINIMLSLGCFFFVMGWQMRFDLMGFANIFSVTFLMMFFIAWIFFVYNKNILSPFLHGMKVFGLMLVGKRTKESYYEYSQKIAQNPIPKYIYVPTFIVSLIYFIPAVILVILASL
ncbi:MAG: DUF3899 domain-containing protein [Acholeplasmataceae bacterium]|nr:DUF3899 domain-containing protein [Acholeplasmataceae bacterium]